MVLSTPMGNNQWTKCHPFLLFNLMTLGIQKLDMDMCMFTSQVLVMTKNIVSLISDSYSVENNQRLHLSFGEKGMGLHIFRNNNTKMMFNFSKR